MFTFLCLMLYEYAPIDKPFRWSRLFNCIITSSKETKCSIYTYQQGKTNLPMLDHSLVLIFGFGNPLLNTCIIGISQFPAWCIATLILWTLTLGGNIYVGVRLHCYVCLSFRTYTSFVLQSTLEWLNFQDIIDKVYLINLLSYID